MKLMALLLLLQRATLAEKEVTTLKEQLANNPPNAGDGKESGNNNMDRHSFENEIASKEKEVSISVFFYLLIRLARLYLCLRCKSRK